MIKWDGMLKIHRKTQKIQLYICKFQMCFMEEG